MQRHDMRRGDDWVPSSIVATFFREALIKLITFMVRKAHRERYRYITVVVRIYGINDTKLGSGSITLVKQ